jgi:hypothetical protein
MVVENLNQLREKEIILNIYINIFLCDVLCIYFI